MKHFYLSIITLFFLFSCSSGENNKISYYGNTFDLTNVIASTDLKQQLGDKETVSLKLEGEISGVCQKKGCWLKMPLEEGGQDVFVKFKDYKFFVPMDATGKKAFITGVAQKETIDVATLKHYAEDAGKSEEEIAEIDVPQVKYTFVADGVAIENN